MGVSIVNHWGNTGELENVVSALSVFRPDILEGLEAVEFVNHRLSQGKTGQAYAIYSPSGRRIMLTRDEPRDWRSSADRLNQKLATSTLLHEAAHHIWFQDRDASLRRVWALALLADGLQIDGADREEEFAKMFQAWYFDKEGFAKFYPEVAQFYAQLTQQ